MTTTTQIQQALEALKLAKSALEELLSCSMADPQRGRANEGQRVTINATKEIRRNLEHALSAINADQQSSAPCPTCGERTPVDHIHTCSPQVKDGAPEASERDMNYELGKAIHKFMEGNPSEIEVSVFAKGWQAARQARPCVPEWISVDDRLPNDRQPVAFVVRSKNSIFEPSFEHLHGRVLGGTFVSGQGFGIPGLTIGASHWMPLPAAPSVQSNDSDRKE